MILSHQIWDILISDVPDHLPESGGILGTKDGETITDICLDPGSCSASKCCSYIPDVEKLNNCIEKWAECGVAFSGIFHTHFADNRTLSDADLDYIQKIMNAMPETVQFLYFPILVFPCRELVVYRAELHGRSTHIQQEQCTLSE